MEVRRVRAKEELMSDLEDRKTQMRAIGEEMKAALAREYELDRMRTEIGANYAMSEAFHALDDVEKEVQRIKQQLQADKADLAAWEAQTAEERSRGLFFKSLYSLTRNHGNPQQIRSPFRLYLFSYLSAFLALLVINDVLVMSSVPRPEAAEAAAVEAAVTMPHVAKDALYGMLSAGLGYVAVLERQALGQAQQQQQHQQQQQQDGDEP
ncbi:hypothetical protein VOLCADRAFT_95786 [Volvox carteri f. nagariensis]|uniref:Uncharacterized protein n=1 Tax=Volvox carteri f. nagariensis TaxID=3068 RepID=D8U8D7_VOLCA|nr:uncharacterized protein VOLCADRAFT_95786 [Volvox carteri f. nagariensis]EFJ43958.1 hypothetical protein VOLCADRAFT_95786 [Volvox carteri f. nagariensis]|eukprot:XP_002954970.1 hypothetical protein VOLCADRAFT_95786 [Volvox carteri f. nagariensis]